VPSRYYSAGHQDYSITASLFKFKSYLIYSLGDFPFFHRPILFCGGADKGILENIYHKKTFFSQ